MKWDAPKYPELPQWERWFAWHPVTVWHEGRNIRVWWEYVERQPYWRDESSCYWYRVIGGQTLEEQT